MYPLNRRRQRGQPGNPLRDAIQRLPPEELDIGFGGGHLLSRRRSTAEIQPRPAPAGPRGDGRVRYRVVRTAERHVLLGPQQPDELQELPGPGITLRLVVGDVAVGRQVVLPAHDVDEQPPAAQVIQGGGRAGEMGGLPVAGPDRYQRLEGGGAGREGGGDGERIGTPPARAEQRAAPAVFLHDPGKRRGQAEIRPPARDVIAAVPGLHRVRDVPEELHISSLTHRNRSFPEIVNLRLTNPTPST
jgi:hypothetical protein